MEEYLHFFLNKTAFTSSVKPSSPPFCCCSSGHNTIVT